MQGAILEQQIAEAIKLVLSQLPGWSGVRLEECSEPDLVDFRVEARVHDRAVSFFIEAKRSWHPKTLDNPKRASSKDGKPIVLVAASIQKNLAQQLREKHLNYLDTAGNAYLDIPGVYVFQETQSPPLIDLDPKRRIGETFSPSAVKIGLQLLLEPSLVSTALRYLADRSDVALGSAKKAMDAFMEDGFVLDAGKKGKLLVNRELFFEKWVEAYNQRLRPKKALGKYSTPMESLELEGCDVCWGGDQAAFALTQNLSSIEKVLYLYGNTRALQVKNRLRPDPEGEITLLEATWLQEQESLAGIAPVFIVYADLIHTRDPRCREVARVLFEQKIKALLNG